MSQPDVEYWVPASGFEGYYEASNLGRVRSLSRLAACSSNPNILITKPGKILSCKLKNLNKYINVKLSVKGIVYTRQLHKLILASFSSPLFSKAQVNHKDRNKRNNCLSNLEWVTSKENIIHAVPFRRQPKGDTHHSSKITSEEVKIIIKMRKENYTYKDIAYSLSTTTKIVGDILRGRTWT